MRTVYFFAWWTLVVSPWFAEAALLAAEPGAPVYVVDLPAGVANPPDSAYRWDLQPDTRELYRNPDGSCVQCSIGMCGMNQADATAGREGAWAAASLLWDTRFGPKVRGGSWPSRVEDYCAKREIKAYNVTGDATWDWMKWAAKTGRFAAIGAGSRHFQTLCGWDPDSNTWWVCNNNSPTVVDRYSWNQFQQLHLASGRWCVILDYPPPPRNPKYVTWW